MTYSIVYSSVTGNTEQLAQAIQQAVGATYCGKPSDEALAADTIFIGFWSTRYSCGADIQAFMKQLSGKKVFLFGTDGFGDTKEFYEKILESAQTHLPASNELIGSYMCLGKVTDKMQTHIKEGAPELYAEIKEVLAEAAHHPNQADLDELVASVKKALTK